MFIKHEMLTLRDCIPKTHEFFFVFWSLGFVIVTCVFFLFSIRSISGTYQINMSFIHMIICRIITVRDCVSRTQKKKKKNLWFLNFNEVWKNG